MRRATYSSCFRILGVMLVFAAPALTQLTSVNEGMLVADNPSLGARFGTSAAIAGDTAVVGAPFADSALGGPGSGAAYVYVRNAGAWSLQTRLEAAGSVAGDQVGNAVAISGETIVVGAFADDGFKGSARVFVRSGATWTEQALLTADDGAAADRFGTSVAILGDTIAVGAPRHLSLTGFVKAGQVYVFVRSGTAWSLQSKLAASDAGAGDFLGTSVALDGNTLLAGAPGDDNAAGADAGAGYVFVRSGTSWSQQAKLTDALGVPADQLGNSAALSGNTAALGTYHPLGAGQTSAGSVAVHVRSGTTWTQQATLTAADADLGDQFGAALALAGDALVIGAPADSNSGGQATGATYIFVRGAGTWGQKLKLLMDDVASGDFFGSAVGISGNMLIASSWQDTTSVSQAGSAQVIRLQGDWDNVGFGLAGVSGVPLLGGTGPLIGGLPATIVLANARASAPCVAFVSLALTPTPFKGGTLAALPALLAISLATSPAGSLSLGFGWPSGLPTGTALYFQFAIADPAAVAGASLSNVARATTP